MVPKMKRSARFRAGNSPSKREAGVAFELVWYRRDLFRRTKTPAVAEANRIAH
jgi:hypothetical protein